MIERNGQCLHTTHLSLALSLRSVLAAMPIHGLLLAPMGCRNKDVSKGVATLLVLLGGGLSVLCARLLPAP